MKISAIFLFAHVNALQIINYLETLRASTAFVGGMELFQTFLLSLITQVDVLVDVGSMPL